MIVQVVSEKDWKLHNLNLAIELYGSGLVSKKEALRRMGYDDSTAEWLMGSEEPPVKFAITGQGADEVQIDYSDPTAIISPNWQKRRRCKYCGVRPEKEYGTCDHCGAPL